MRSAFGGFPWRSGSVLGAVALLMLPACRRTANDGPEGTATGTTSSPAPSAATAPVDTTVKLCGPAAVHPSYVVRERTRADFRDVHQSGNPLVPRLSLRISVPAGLSQADLQANVCAALMTAGLVGSALGQDVPAPPPAATGHENCGRWTLACGRLFETHEQATMLLDTHTGALYLVGHARLIPVAKP